MVTVTEAGIWSIVSMREHEFCLFFSFLLVTAHNVNSAGFICQSEWTDEEEWLCNC